MSICYKFKTLKYKEQGKHVHSVQSAYNYINFVVLNSSLASQSFPSMTLPTGHELTALKLVCTSSFCGEGKAFERS